MVRKSRESANPGLGFRVLYLKKGDAEKEKAKHA